MIINSRNDINAKISTIFFLNYMFYRLIKYISLFSNYIVKHKFVHCYQYIGNIKFIILKQNQTHIASQGNL